MKVALTVNGLTTHMQTFFLLESMFPTKISLSIFHSLILDCRRMRYYRVYVLVYGHHLQLARLVCEYFLWVILCSWMPFLATFQENCITSLWWKPSICIEYYLHDINCLSNNTAHIGILSVWMHRLLKLCVFVL